MLKIEAIVRPERATSIGSALEEAGAGGFYMVNITGKGNQKGVEVLTGRGTSSITRSALPKTLIVTVIPDKMKKSIIEVLIGGAKTGEGVIGDGKIFVSKRDEAIRIRTNDAGDKAL